MVSYGTWMQPKSISYLSIIHLGWYIGGCWFTFAPNFSQGIMCRVTPQEWGILVIILCEGGTKGCLFWECPAPRVFVVENFEFFFPHYTMEKKKEIKMMWVFSKNGMFTFSGILVFEMPWKILHFIIVDITTLGEGLK